MHKTCCCRWFVEYSSHVKRKYMKVGEGSLIKQVDTYLTTSDGKLFLFPKIRLFLIMFGLIKEPFKGTSFKSNELVNLQPKSH